MYTYIQREYYLGYSFNNELTYEYLITLQMSNESIEKFLLLQLSVVIMQFNLKLSGLSDALVPIGTKPKMMLKKLKGKGKYLYISLQIRLPAAGFISGGPQL